MIDISPKWDYKGEGFNGKCQAANGKFIRMFRLIVENDFPRDNPQIEPGSKLPN